MRTAPGRCTSQGRLPRPIPNPGIHGPYDECIATVDLQYPDQKIAIEYDSDLHRIHKRKWRMDRAKRQNLDDLGWKVFAFTADDVFVDPGYTIDRVLTALRERGHPGLPSEPDPERPSPFTSDNATTGTDS